MDSLREVRDMGTAMRRGILYFALASAVAIFAASAGAFQLVYDRAVDKAKTEYLKGETFLAREALERIAAVSFSDSKARYNLGMAHLLSDYRYTEALANFRMIAENEKVDRQLRSQAYYLMAWTVMLELLKSKSSSRQDPYSEALGYLREGLKLDASHTDSKRLYELITHYKNFLKPPPQPATEKIVPDSGQIPGGSDEEPKP